MLYAIIAVLILIADQWVKYWTTVNIVLDTGESALIPGFVKLVNVHNTGAAFGFLSSAESARWIFVIIAAVFVIALIIIIARRVFPSKFASFCCTMALAGAIGNCIDRIFCGYVVDMFKLEFINFAVFNIADIFLVLACILFILYLLFGYKGSENEEAETAEEDDEPEKEKKSRKSRKATAEKKPVSDDEIVVNSIESAEVPEESVMPITDKVEPKKHDDAYWAASKGSNISELKKEMSAAAKNAAPAAEKETPMPVKKAETPVDIDLSSDEFSVDAILNEFKSDF